MSEGDGTEHGTGLDTVDGAEDGAGRDHGPRRTISIPAVVAVVATGLAVIPTIATMAHVRGLTWIPAGDEAVEAFQVARVGGVQTPLVGVYSVHGWAHPGPALYYLLAGPHRLFGGDLDGLFLGAGVLSAVCIGVIGWLAWRRRRLLGVLAALAVVMTFLAAKGPSQLVAIWNPNTALLPYFAMLLACWGLLEDDEPLLPVTIGLASVAVQMNVAYGALVAGAAAVVVGLHLVRRRAGEQPRRPSARTWRWTVVVAVVLWLPPAIDLVFGSHNLARVGRLLPHRSRWRAGRDRRRRRPVQRLPADRRSVDRRTDAGRRRGPATRGAVGPARPVRRARRHGLPGSAMDPGGGWQPRSWR